MTDQTEIKEFQTPKALKSLKEHRKEVEKEDLKAGGIKCKATKNIDGRDLIVFPEDCASFGTNVGLKGCHHWNPELKLCIHPQFYRDISDKAKEMLGQFE